MKAVDLFCGAGGMALGAESAGLEVEFAIDSCKHALMTYSSNHPKTECIRADIGHIDRLPFYSPGKELIVFGGPPCQGFSTANRRTWTRDNEKNWLLVNSVRSLAQLKPLAVVLENVKGFLELDKGHFLHLVNDAMECLNLSLHVWRLNSADFGVPQRRNRVFLVGLPKGARCSLPNPTVARYAVVEEAISDLPKLSNGARFNWLPYENPPQSTYQERMRNGMKGCANHLVTKNADHIVKRYSYIPEGGNWKNIPTNLLRGYTKLSNCHTSIYHRLVRELPAPVLGNFRKNMIIHPTEDRGLSVREAARLQSFPDNYAFHGSIGFQQQQVADAVPPLMAESVFRSILKSLE